MGRFDVVGWMVHGNVANGLKLFHVEHFAYLFAYINKNPYLCTQIKCYGIRFERLRCEARAFFFVYIVRFSQFMC